MRNITCVTLGKVQRWEPHRLPTGLMSCSILLTGWSLRKFPRFLMLNGDLRVWRAPLSKHRAQPSELAKDTCFLTQGRRQLSYSIHREQNFINFNNASLGSWN